MNNTPTPTDPREEKPFIPPDILAMSPEKRAQFIEQFNAPLTPKMHPNDDLQSTNSKLAAEIAEYAELKRLIAACHFDTSDPVAVVRSIIEGNMKDRAELDRLRQAIVAKGGDEHSPTEWAYEQACKALHSKHAELEAARKELSRWKKSFDGHVYIEDSKYAQLCADRDTALAAKEAALAGLRDIDRAIAGFFWTSDDGENLRDAEPEESGAPQWFIETWKGLRILIAALTPAPTQEPPAGGVTISTSQTEQLSGTDRNMPGKPNEITALASGPVVIMGEPYDPTKFDSVPVHTSRNRAGEEGR